MRPFVAIVVIVVGLVVAPTGAPGATVPSAAGPGPTSTGTFDLLYEDPVDRAGAPVVEPGPRAVVDTPDGPLTLPAVPVDARPGDRVRVDHRSGEVEVVSAVAEAPVTGTEDVLVVPGSSFNVPYRNHFRVTLLPEPDALREVFARIDRVLSRRVEAGRDGAARAVGA